MVRNNLKIGWRNIGRNKVSSFINIAGLAIGLAAVILIAFFVQDELQYDKFFKKADHIFQVNLDGKMGGDEFINGNTAAPVGAALVSAFPEIETYTRIYRPSDLLVRYEPEKQAPAFFTERGVLVVDSNFLDVFSYKMIAGDPLTCLGKPNGIVITTEMAKKYFGDQPAMGKVLLFGEERTPHTVTGILASLPSQASIQFGMLLPASAFSVLKRFNWSWVWLQVSTYVRLRDNAKVDAASIQRLEAKFPSMVREQAASAFERIGKPFDEFLKNGGRWDLHLQPLTRVHLYSAGIASRLSTLSSIKYVYIFSVIAVFLILLACVNFMNLSTAQSARRAKEIGVRKVLGSVRSQLIRQFLMEALLYSLIATVIALILVMLCLKPFNAIAGKSLTFGLIFSHYNWLFLLALSLLTGLLAGSYPAFYLTTFKPVAVLKGMKLFKSNLAGLLVRNGLVVFQFTVSTALIISTLVVFRQLRYTQNKDLGLNKENIVVIANSNRLNGKEEAFREELSRLPEVAQASTSTSIPTKENFGDSYIPEPGDTQEELIKDISLSSFIVDEHFVPTLGIQLLKGRNFSKDFSDSASVILNETAAKQIGWKNPVGRWLQYPGGQQRFKVIGVAKDFSTQSIRTIVGPFALFYTTSQTYDLGAWTTMVRLKPGNMSSSLSKLENKWKSFAPNTPFDFSFLDSEFEALYRPEQRLGTVFSIFTLLSIFVACLGLFGLATYTAEKRAKEIGIRKVLGASVTGVVAMLSKDFIKLVLLSAVIAFPVAWLGMNKWLEDFAYRIHIGPWVFVIAGLIAIMIALLTVSLQAIKAAVANPVKSLRTE